MILIGGDFAPIGTCADNLRDLDRTAFTGPLADLIAKARHVVVNLECPVTEVGTPITKCGINMRAAPAALAAAKAAGIDCFSLANNHIFDFGQPGLEDTFACLEQNGCTHWGAGLQADQVRPSMVLMLGEKRIGFLSIAEHEFSIASTHHGGAYGLDYLGNLNAVVELKARCDHVVVLYHGGVEHYRLPTPKQQRFLRHLVRAGADIVLCQHSHIIGATETLPTGVIHYGQGNFLFDTPKHATGDRVSSWARGFLLSLELNGDRIVTGIHYTRQDGEGRVGLAPLSDEERTLFAGLSETVADPDQVAREWAAFVQSRQVDYWSRLYGWSRIRRVLSRKLGWTFGTRPGQRWAIIRNVVECESHREALEVLWELQDRGVAGNERLGH